jgi:putative ubiquitin-RnfH superfamily antitoxin RatB of RatAB toxin-antitoxin module
MTADEFDDGLIAVEVAFAAPEAQAIVAVNVASGTTAEEAVVQSGISKRFAEVEMPMPLGIFGHAVKPDYVLREGDRVEIYRPLLADPKEVRKRKAAEAKAANAAK